MNRHLLWLLAALLAGASSCGSGGSKWVTLELTDAASETCTPVSGFDTLRYFLLTTRNGDFGGSGRSAGPFNPDRVYREGVLPKNGKFYIDSVLRDDYLFLRVEAVTGGVRFRTNERISRLEERPGDTLPIPVCLTAGLSNE
ncbi:hypothetical protein [Flaviaesturariibacter amylovorans]|uniref:hypothetical protein n=1 Tax=Flaviaesturariibacter amylovorans TaxID=1084520 RepID=UPI0031E9A348